MAVCASPILAAVFESTHLGDVSRESLYLAPDVAPSSWRVADYLHGTFCEYDPSDQEQTLQTNRKIASYKAAANKE